MESNLSDDTWMLSLDKDEMYILHELLQSHKSNSEVVLREDAIKLIDEFASRYFRRFEN